MALFGRKQESDTSAPKPLGGDSSIQEWLNHPVGGAVLTDIEATYASTLGEERVNSALATMPLPVNGDALAASITFLLSDDGVNVNGAVLPSDGGWSVQ